MRVVDQLWETMLMDRTRVRRSQLLQIALQTHPPTMPGHVVPLLAVVVAAQPQVGAASPPG